MVTLVDPCNNGYKTVIVSAECFEYLWLHLCSFVVQQKIQDASEGWPVVQCSRRERRFCTNCDQQGQPWTSRVCSRRTAGHGCREVWRVRGQLWACVSIDALLDSGRRCSHRLQHWRTPQGNLHLNAHFPGELRLASPPSAFLHLFWKRTFWNQWNSLFMGQMFLLSLSQQFHGTEGNAENWPQTVAGHHPYFTYYQTPNGSGSGSFMSAVHCLNSWR